MSRVGRLPIPVPSGVTCELKGTHLRVKGPKGMLERELRPEVAVNVDGGEITVTRSSDQPKHRAMHGLTRALINNMVLGVTEGFERTLVIEGVGYRASLQGKNLNLSVGYSHPITIEPPEGISIAVEGTQIVKVAGIDRELVGQVAANIRAIRKPEPYKGKGIRYSEERVRRKVGKSGSK